MPFGDGTGPLGAGGTGVRGGGRWGWRHVFRGAGCRIWQQTGVGPADSTWPEYEALKTHAATLEPSLEEMRRRVERLEAKSKAE